eukprot:CAMPEP_0194487792 /NCGR_PEP_ID=MMETSP0253-20130528/7958_1 /TAXON_ID=2966 /ORGANISM="Noctiluca scintillans" /LENGTH=30 /DNA_ID= /DNA_START= /DNA_END= /DNA_ORIENTATION=
MAHDLLDLICGEIVACEQRLCLAIEPVVAE